jgi:broad specificity phosphatase PhoE
MIHRLDTIVHEMERHREPLLIIAHQGILRLLYAYYMGLPRERAP